MNSFNAFRSPAARAAGYFFVCAAAVAVAWTQDVTTSTVQHGPSSFETKVRNAEVVYVEGNDLVIKVENGRVEHLVVPETDKFHIDGQVKSVYDLKPGMKLTETITTKTTPRYVKTIRTIEGKIWRVHPPNSVIVSLPDNTNLHYRIPGHATFTVNGESASRTAFDLRQGMNFRATIVQDEPWTILDTTKHVVAEAPALETPQEVGTLLIEEPTAPETKAEEAKSEEQVTMAKADLPEELPETGRSLPLIGLMGASAAATSLGLRLRRRVAS